MYGTTSAAFNYKKKYFGWTSQLAVFTYYVFNIPHSAWISLLNKRAANHDRFSYIQMNGL